MASSAVPFRILAASGILLLAACAANRFASLKPGLTEEAARQQLGQEALLLERPAYKAYFYEKSSGSYAFLKFVDGRLVDRGEVPRWIVNPEVPFNPKKPLRKDENLFLCMRLVKIGLPEEALGLMRRYVAEHPDTAYHEIPQSHLFGELGMADSAVAVHERALAATKDPKEISRKKNNLLATHIRLRRLDQAEALALELLADTTLDSAALHGMHYNLGCIYSRQGRKALAIEQLAKAVDLRPKQWARSYLDTDPDWDNVRTEPDFLAQRKRLPPGKAKD